MGKRKDVASGMIIIILLFCIAAWYARATVAVSAVTVTHSSPQVKSVTYCECLGLYLGSSDRHHGICYGIYISCRDKIEEVGPMID